MRYFFTVSNIVVIDLNESALLNFTIIKETFPKIQKYDSRFFALTPTFFPATQPREG